ncbi:mechanosensitive ion channel protein MscS [Chryseobacterium flavum]|uniref:Mechanosensitive ion channel protein MscS n=1 Tax=Chryseobacterium flavum TaxID=415851 RepID=A0A3D9CLT8_9FLAO|nr:mechanosensitive ion channel domain-containing protein [Chryseobacterium flavum]REC66680.1 mechanosensitive ion channel protein MscS [Chryseobacterium flavum]
MLKKNSVLIITVLIFFSSFFHAQEKPGNEPQKNISTLMNETTSGDYLLAIEKAGEVLQSSYIDAEFTTEAYLVFSDIDKTDKDMDVILRSVKAANLNVRNQQMYQTILEQLKIKLDNQSKFINKQDSIQNSIQSRIASLGKDKVVMAFVKDTLRQKQFQKEIQELTKQYKKTAALLSKNAKTLNGKKRKILENKTAVFYALQTVEERLQKSEINLIKKEYPLLWNVGAKADGEDISANFSGKIGVEKEVTLYYITRIITGLFIAGIFMLLIWVYLHNNLKYLKKAGCLDNLEALNFSFLNKGAFVPVLVLGLYIVILSNLYAPVVFTTMLHFILLISISFLFRGSWQKTSRYNWLFLILLFTVSSFINLFVPVSFTERCVFILINAGAVFYIIKQLKIPDNGLFKLKFFRWTGFIFICFCVLSVILNIFGRVSLSHTLSLAATVALTQVIALSVLLKIFIEIILLQIYRTRVQRGIVTIFDHKNLSDNLKTPFIIITVYLWFVVTASYLNIWGSISDSMVSLLKYTVHIGSLSFTLGSVLLFFAMIWIAHLLQKYAAYFFGEIEDEDEENINKKQHSRLLIIRLVLLTGGYLLAVLASGIPLDKVSIIIGALGVGVGLGLQGIVSNFVSGVILIFGRAIQIGDIIEISSQQGRVKSMDLRTTKINAPNGSEIIIPNGSLLSQNITNWTYTDNLKQVEISFNLKGETTPEDINGIIRETISGMPMIEQTRPCQIYYNTLSKESFGVLIKFWCSIYRTEEVISETKQALFKAFGNHNIDITI